MTSDSYIAEDDTADVRDAAKSYINRGFKVVPLDPGTKLTFAKGWPDFRIAAEEVDSEFKDDSNIGLILGEPSGWLVDVDLDCDEAVELAPQFLPPTPAVTGRGNRPGSHWWYISENAETRNYQDPQNESKTTTIELRSTGLQTVVGPSVHPDGDRYDLLEAEPAIVPFGLLDAAVKGLHEAVLKARGHEVQESRPEKTDASEPRESSSVSTWHVRPGDDFNARGDIRPVLEAAKWKRHGGPPDNEYWIRPGKEKGEHSATFNGEVFFVHSTGAPGFAKDDACSKFEVYTRLLHGGDHTAAAATLAAEGFGQQESFDEVDLSGLTTGQGKPNQPKPVVPGELPQMATMEEHLLDAPGFIHDVAQYTMDTAKNPNRIMAFAGALSLQAVLCSRLVMAHDRTRPNIYVLVAANSGAGKNRPREVNSEILSRCGMSKLAGAVMKSGPGIEEFLKDSPRILFQTDEFDEMLDRLNEGQDPNLHTVNEMMLTMWGESKNELYPMRATVNARKGKGNSNEKPITHIHHPHLNVFGTAVPKTLYSSFSERMLAKGVVGRMIILDAGYRCPSQVPDFTEIPDSIIEQAMLWHDPAADSPDGNMAGIYPKARAVPIDDDALELHRQITQLEDAEYSAGERNGDQIHLTLWARFCERTVKLALLYACSECPENPRITRAGFEWATEFMRSQIKRMIYLTREHYTENAYAGQLKKVYDSVAAGVSRESISEQGWATRSWVRKHTKIKSNELIELLGNLEETGFIASRNGLATGGRPRQEFCILAPWATA